jgi:L-iditol 2-dehydrogenase
MCEDLAFLNGAFAEYIVVPPRIVDQNLYEIPEGMEFSRAALWSPWPAPCTGWSGRLYPSGIR